MSSPLRSYLHVDEFSSAKELAEYLHLLDKNDELYNSYFKWKSTGEFINTYFWYAIYLKNATPSVDLISHFLLFLYCLKHNRCRVCAMLHDEESISQPKWYEDVNDWWRGQGRYLLRIKATRSTINFC